MRVHELDSGELRGADRGSDCGRRFADLIAATWAGYRGQFEAMGIPDATVREVADGSYESLCSWAPGIAAEIEAIGAGSGVGTTELMALTARTEILATATTVDECSTAVHVPAEGVPVAFQTWDWHEHLMWSYRTDARRGVRTFTEFGMPAKIGVNDAGLSVNFNILHHRSDGTRPGVGAGVPVHAVVRRVLDEAGSVGEAIDIVRSARVNASSVLTVLAGDGVASIELSPAGVAVIRPAGEWLVHTNHFLDPELARGGVVPEASTTDTRHAHLTTVTAAPVDTDSLVSLAKGLTGSPSAPICMRPDPSLPEHERWQTLLTVRLVPSAGTFDWWAGSPEEVWS